MPVFTFEAIDKSGKKVLDKVEADNLNNAIVKIRELSFFPVQVHELDGKSALGKGLKKSSLLSSLSTREFSFSHVSQKQLALFTRQFATLNTSGVPVLRSINILRDQQKPGYFRNVLSDVSKDVESGLSLSDALSKYPKVFSSLYINMIKSGEMGGVLEVVLIRLADFSERTQRLSSRIRAALMYPIFVVLITALILTSLVTFVVPKFMSIFSELGVDMPTPTLILLSVSNLLKHRWYLIIFALIAIVLIYKKLQKSPVIRLKTDSIKLRLPLFGTLLRKVVVARFARTFGTLIRSGVPILHALDIAKDISGNLVFSNAISKIHDSIREGDTISEPLAKSSIFPPVVVNMIDVGEETGKLDSMLLKVADTYGDDVEATITGLTAILEPFLIVMVSIIVGFIIISMLLPLLSLVTTLS